MNPEGRPVFSIVAPTYKRPQALARLLRGIEELDFPLASVEVVLVDDSGSGGIEDVVGPFRARLEIRVLSSPHLGPAPARKIGVNAARGRYLAFTDDDCVPATDWLTRLDAGFAGNPEAAIGGPTINALAANPYSTATQAMIDYLQEQSNRGEVRYLTTSNVAFPAAGLRAVDALDSSWHIWGGEDRNLSRVWRSAGGQMLYDAQLRVYHSHPLNFKTYWNQHFRYGCGSSRFHRESGFESAGFYLGLLTTGIRRHGFRRGWRTAGLILLAQVPTLCGFVHERLFGA